MATVVLGIEIRRYRVYNIWRSQLRLLEEYVVPNVYDSERRRVSYCGTTWNGRAQATAPGVWHHRRGFGRVVSQTLYSHQRL
ncbi:DUF2270 domain-containing protein [Halonotius pteroides]|uniref:DUF2270 domain-containing protein n=1 Tax=Halonotius pteroides TaxID=268735 RepID=UPI001F0B8CE8|nr:DUF2270 domain-containing protein [Halonotius pteroides]